MRVDTAGIAAAAALVTTIERARFDLEALDIGAPGTVWARLGGFREALSTRIGMLERVLAAASPSGPTASPEVVTTIGNEEEAIWRDARALSWGPPADALVRIPTTLRVVEELDAALAAHAAQRRYAVAGNLALVAWPGHAAIETIEGLLRGHGLVGQVLRGPVGRSFIGALRDDTFELRLKGVLDPDGRF